MSPDDYARAAAEERRFLAFRAYLDADAPLLARELRRAWTRRHEAHPLERIPGIALWDELRPPLPHAAPELEARVVDCLAWALAAAPLLTREGFAVACRTLDSEWVDVEVRAFCVATGAFVSRSTPAFRRTRERFAVTDSGVEVLGRLTAIVW